MHPPRISETSSQQPPLPQVPDQECVEVEARTKPNMPNSVRRYILEKRQRTHSTLTDRVWPRAENDGRISIMIILTRNLLFGSPARPF